LGFIVRQDAVVRAAVEAAGAPPRARGFEDTPTKVQGYQVLVTEIQKLTGLRFGRASSPSVDVYARRRAGRPRGAARALGGEAIRALRRVDDLIVD
jgi:hypothetical protein